MSLAPVLANPKGAVVPSPSQTTEKPIPKAPTKEGNGSSPTPSDHSKDASKSNGGLRIVLGGNPKKVGTLTAPASAAKMPLTMDDFRKAFKDAKAPGSKNPTFTDAAAKANKAGSKIDFKSTPSTGTQSKGSTGGKPETVATRVETSEGDRAPKLGDRAPNARYPRTFAPSAPEARGK